MQDINGENWVALVLLVFRESAAAWSLADGRSSSADEPGSRLSLQGHVLEENHFHAARLTM